MAAHHFTPHLSTHFTPHLQTVPPHLPVFLPSDTLLAMNQGKRIGISFPSIDETIRSHEDRLASCRVTIGSMDAHLPPIDLPLQGPPVPVH